MKYTPGPWKAFHSKGLFSHVVHDMKEHKSVKEWSEDQFGRSYSDFEAQPNGDCSTIHTQNSSNDANLISSAPDLYEALKECQKLMLKGFRGVSPMAKKAIQKAEGK